MYAYTSINSSYNTTQHIEFILTMQEISVQQYKTQHITDLTAKTTQQLTQLIIQSLASYQNKVMIII
jgi:hypothetical protein